ncbi:MAG: DUF488 domain-containing protein [Candidatus Cloacimonetes bacterium]|nr:DUF488 domain-containing protein [Candidatus Cloacimonadota bacterium]
MRSYTDSHYNDKEHLELLDNYENVFLPQAEKELGEIRELQVKYNRIALLCYEKDAGFCHRTRIIKKLSKEN